MKTSSGSRSGDPARGLRDFAVALAARVVAGIRDAGDRALDRPVADDGADVQYAVDRLGEEGLADLVEAHLGAELRVRLLSEGLPEEGVDVGRPGGRPFRLLVDPIDGTRGLMTGKRSAWVLAGLAPDRGPGTRLSDIEISVMAEIPLPGQARSDVFLARRGGGVEARRLDLLSGAETPLASRRSGARSFDHGFATFVRYFPGAKDLIGAVEEAFWARIYGEARGHRGIVFEDQYVSSAGQLHGVMTGKDRLVADLRPLFRDAIRARGLFRPLCTHPYDLAALLVAEEAGVLVTDPRGDPLDAPLDVRTDVAFVAWANAELRALGEPALVSVLRSAGYL